MNMSDPHHTSERDWRHTVVETRLGYAFTRVESYVRIYSTGSEANPLIGEVPVMEFVSPGGFINCEERQDQSDYQHVRLPQLPNPSVTTIRFSTGGDSEQYLGSYTPITATMPYTPEFSQELSNGQAWSIVPQIDASDIPFDMAPTLPVVPILTDGLNPSQWNDSLQMQIMNDNVEEYLSVHFRFIKDRRNADNTFLSPVLYGVEPYLFAITSIQCRNTVVTGAVITSIFQVKLGLPLAL